MPGYPPSCPSGIIAVSPLVSASRCIKSSGKPIHVIAAVSPCPLMGHTLRPPCFPYWSSSFSLTAKENEAKERPPSTWPSAALAQRLAAAVPQTRPDESGLKQCVTFIRIQPLRSAALNGKTNNTTKYTTERPMLRQA
jgi:hypothetical protein